MTTNPELCATVCPVCQTTPEPARRYGRFFLKCCYWKTKIHRTERAAIRQWNEIIERAVSDVF